MGITASTVRDAVRRAATAARMAEHELNTADSKLGDGDTGLMLRRLLERVSTALPVTEDDIGSVFQACGVASSSATGSSLGTLGTIAMLTLAKATRGRSDIPWTELGALLVGVRDAMLARGGATLGDKTVVDTLDAVAAAVDGLADREHVAQAAVAAAAQSLATFRPRANRIGRARMFADRSIGLDDPGMLALTRLIEGLHQPDPAQAG
ncbi:dihydroxyacetone kinase subunit L [Bradyrhizobium sp. 2TAF24]|uniref:dihydroxyacetone kinase subunit L n=1 Tax=Bradyrhizobium sp. 2TAF24 TaxID=3233011 RepID=UPI003F9050CC